MIMSGSKQYSLSFSCMFGMFTSRGNQQSRSVWLIPCFAVSQSQISCRGQSHWPCIFFVWNGTHGLMGQWIIGTILCISNDHILPICQKVHHIHLLQSNYIWHLTYGAWCMTYDVWHMIHHMMHYELQTIFLYSQYVSLQIWWVPASKFSGTRHLCQDLHHFFFQFLLAKWPPQPLGWIAVITDGLFINGKSNENWWLRGVPPF